MATCGKLPSDLPDDWQEKWGMSFFDKDLAECKLAKQLYDFPKYQKSSVMLQTTIAETTAQQATVRPFHHIYLMKQEWLALLKDDSAPASKITTFQVAYYAIRKNVSVEASVMKLIGNRQQQPNCIYHKSPYLLQGLVRKAKEQYERFYRKPETVRYPSGQPD